MDGSRLAQIRHATSFFRERNQIIVFLMRAGLFIDTNIDVDMLHKNHHPASGAARSRMVIFME
jgi:hypothetical protein